MKIHHTIVRVEINRGAFLEGRDHCITGTIVDSETGVPLYGPVEHNSLSSLRSFYNGIFIAWRMKGDNVELAHRYPETRVYRVPLNPSYIFAIPE